jgi:hypothetical protein
MCTGRLKKFSCLFFLPQLACVLMTFWLPSAAYADCVGPGLGGGGCNGSGNLSNFAPLAGVVFDIVGGILASPGGESCRSGYAPLRGGGCMPAGSQDCGTGNYCSSGYVCVPGGCIPAGASVCGNGYCNAGTICAGFQQCLTPAQLAAQRQQQQAAAAQLAAAQSAALAGCLKAIDAAAADERDTSQTLLDRLAAARNVLGVVLTVPGGICTQFDAQRQIAADDLAQVEAAISQANQRLAECKTQITNLTADIKPGPPWANVFTLEFAARTHVCDDFPDQAQWITSQTQLNKAATYAIAKQQWDNAIANEPKCGSGDVDEMEPGEQEAYWDNIYTLFGPNLDLHPLHIYCVTVAAQTPSSTAQPQPTSPAAVAKTPAVDPPRVSPPAKVAATGASGPPPQPGSTRGAPVPPRVSASPPPPPGKPAPLPSRPSASSPSPHGAPVPVRVGPKEVSCPDETSNGCEQKPPPQPNGPTSVTVGGPIASTPAPVPAPPPKPAPQPSQASGAPANSPGCSDVSGLPGPAVPCPPTRVAVAATGNPPHGDLGPGGQTAQEIIGALPEIVPPVAPAPVPPPSPPPPPKPVASAGSSTTAPKGPCVVVQRMADKHCEPKPSLAAEAINNCGKTLKIRLCLLSQSGTYKNCTDYSPVPDGQSTGTYICDGSGRYSLQCEDQTACSGAKQ